MIIPPVFTAPTRSDAPVRADGVARVETSDGHDDGTRTGEQVNSSRAEFSALMALLGGVSNTARDGQSKSTARAGVSILDRVLDSQLLGDASDAPISELAGASQHASTSATDALRYGIVQNGASPRQPNALVALQTAKSAPSPSDSTPRGVGSSRASTGSDRARLNEVLGRIVARRGGSVDQLKALGDNEAADVRTALDMLLTRAGTASGLEFTSAGSAAANAAAVSAAAAALATANAASALDVATPIKTTDALDPELRTRLERVIARMKNEYGNDVTVVETARSQERQDALYEQGRTRPGAVVTWTRDSAHTRGDAVDVLVDGAWDNAAGFARLQRIAKEEGLRTLGVRDPGHLELAHSQHTSELAATDLTHRDARATPPVSTSAQAAVARVAGIAGVARIADAGAARGTDRGYAARVDQPVATVTVASAGNNAMHADTRRQSFGRGEREGDSRTFADARTRGTARRDTFGTVESSAIGAPNTLSTHATLRTGEASLPAAGAAAAERVADLQQLRADAPAGAVSRMTLNIDGADGGQDRITIDVRGNAVTTQITTDAASADRLRVRTAELQDALSRHGLESDSVRISSANRVEPMDATRLVVAERDGIRLHASQQSTTGDGAWPQGQRERFANAREWEKPETSRQSRDAQRDARQGADQRGQRGTSNGST